MSSSAKDALAALGMDMDEVLEVDSGLRTRPQHRDGRICLCGHGISKHTVLDNGVVICKPSKMDCPCKKVRAVIDAEDTRPFLRRTQGGGPMHALSRGLAALAQSGKSAHWIIDLKCDACGEYSDNLSPVPVTLNGVIMTDATGYDALLCSDCRSRS
jgi:hypothetical protein